MERTRRLVLSQYPGARRQRKRLGGLNAVLIAALLCLTLAAIIACFAPTSVDYPTVRFLNQFATRSLLFDNVVADLTGLDLLQGVVLVAGVWLVWFDAPDPGSRARVAAGVVAAGFSALISRGLQIVLPTHARPTYSETLHFVVPYGITPETLRYWNSFPSDHGALFFALAMVIVIIRPRLGAAAFVWALIVTVSRVYGGMHFPSDVMGGAGLGVALVCASQFSAIRRVCLVFPRWAVERAGVFYALAFVVTWSVATLFDDIRTIGKGLSKFLH